MTIKLDILDGGISGASEAATGTAALQLVEAAGVSDRDDLSPVSEMEHNHAVSWLGGLLGRASCSKVAAQYRDWLVWAQENYDPSIGTYSAFARSKLTALYREHCSLQGAKRIAREREDEERRSAAHRTEEQRVKFIEYWNKRISKLQVALPRIWHVPGFESDHLRQELLLLLLEAVGNGYLDEYAKPGREATYAFLKKQKDKLRNRRKVYEVPMDIDDTLFADRAPSPEDLLLAKRMQPELSRAFVEVRKTLSRNLTDWLDVFLELAQHSPTGARISAAAAAKSAGKSRSAAVRARQKLERAFQRADLQEFL